jgi:hypothetical protein
MRCHASKAKCDALGMPHDLDRTGRTRAPDEAGRSRLCRAKSYTPGSSKSTASDARVCGLEPVPRPLFEHSIDVYTGLLVVERNQPGDPLRLRHW